MGAHGLMMGRMETEDSKKKKDGNRVRAEKLHIKYNFYYVGDGYIRSPNLTIIQYICITNLHIHPQTYN